MKTTQLFFAILTCLSMLFWVCTPAAQQQEKPDEPTADSASASVPTPEKTVSSGDPLIDSLTAIRDQLPSRVYGIDISRYQGNELDVLSAKKDSIRFVIVKATEGNTYTDPKFKQNWDEVGKRGFIRGAYHFYRSNDEPSTQLAHFAQAIADLGQHDLPPIVDFEEGSIQGGTALEIQVDLLSFLNGLEAKFNRVPMIYTDIGTANRYLKDSSLLKYPLWIANYRKGDEPDLPALWRDTGWTFWQKSQSYTLKGVTDDFDIFNGNMLELYRFIKGKD